jgi:DNA-binding NarL/FixJ family response regulator
MYDSKMTSVRGTLAADGTQRPLLTPRAARNHVRIALAIECGEHAFSAETVNTSQTGLALHLHASAARPQPGDILIVRTTADSAEPIRCRVVWVEPPEQNDFGEPVTAVGACFMEPQRVATFLAEADAVRHALLLLAGDDALGDHLERAVAGYCRVLRPRTCANAMSALLTENVSVVLCDESMPYPGPADFLATVRSSFPRAPWVSMVSGADPRASDLAQLINSAQVFRYLHKPLEDAQLVADVRSALRHFDHARESETTRHELERAIDKLERENAALRKPPVS